MAIVNFAVNPNHAFRSTENSTSYFKNSSTYFGWDGQVNYNDQFGLYFDRLTEISVRFSFVAENTGYVDSNYNFIRLYVYDEDGASYGYPVCLKGHNDGYIYMYESLTTGSYVQTTLFRLSNSVWETVDLQVKLDSVDGYIRAYRDEVLVYEFVGDTLTNSGLPSDTAFERLLFLKLTNSTVYYQYYNNVIVTDGEDTRGMKISQIPIVGEGDVSEFSGTYANIDNLHLEDSTSVHTPEVEKLSRYALDDLSVTLAGKEIKAVGINGRGRVGHGEVNSIEVSLSDGVNEATGSNTITDKSYFQSANHVFNTALSGSSWTPEDLAGLQIGVKTKA